MKYKLISALIFSAILLTACAKSSQSEPTEMAAETTSIETTEITTIATSTITTTETEMTTTAPEADTLVMRPIPSDKPFEVMACEITELSLVEAEEDFPDQAALKVAKEVCYANNTEDIISYNEAMEREGGAPVKTAENIRFAQGVSYDFDLDGEDESVICLHYLPEIGLGGGYCVYVDGENYEVLMSGGNTGITVSILDFDGYRFMKLYTSSGAIFYSEDIFGFESGMPEVLLDIEHDSNSISYENGIFYCFVKYDVTSYPFVFCLDGKVRQLAIEEITPEDFEAHVENGGAYLDTLDGLETIYTSGYYMYWLVCEDEELYLYPDEDGTYSQSESYGDPDTQFTDELVYGKDVWAAVPISKS